MHEEYHPSSSALELIIAVLVHLAIIVPTVLVVRACIKDHHQQTQKINKCISEHNARPFIKEEPYATTSSGCKIIKISQFDENCRMTLSPVYLSECGGTVSWDEQVGKTTERRSNSTTGPKR